MNKLELLDLLAKLDQEVRRIEGELNKLSTRIYIEINKLRGR